MLTFRSSSKIKASDLFGRKISKKRKNKNQEKGTFFRRLLSSIFDDDDFAGNSLERTEVLAAPEAAQRIENAFLLFGNKQYASSIAWCRELEKSLPEVDGLLLTEVIHPKSGRDHSEERPSIDMPVQDVLSALDEHIKDCHTEKDFEKLAATQWLTRIVARYQMAFGLDKYTLALKSLMQA